VFENIKFGKKRGRECSDGAKEMNSYFIHYQLVY